jgi:hypothetical protein
MGGDIPFGMTYSDGESFVLSGTPTWEATYYLNIRIIDSDNPPEVTDRSVSLKVVPPSVACGDADSNDLISIADAVFLINYIFGGGPAPELIAADADCSGSASIGDAVYLINYIFGGGPAPCENCP